MSFLCCWILSNSGNNQKTRLMGSDKPWEECRGERERTGGGTLCERDRVCGVEAKRERKRERERERARSVW